jgi:hypothetical protein
MTDRSPSSTTNLDRYGNPALEWPRALEAAKAGNTADVTWFLGTVDPDGASHAAGVGAVYHDGDLYFTSNLEARKARNLADRDACSIAVRLSGIDLVFEGRAEMVRDGQTLEALARMYRDGGWPAEVKDGALTAPFSAPSAGPPPWHVFRMSFETVYGVASEEPHGATRWRFED